MRALRALASLRGSPAGLGIGIVSVGAVAELDILRRLAFGLEQHNKIAGSLEIRRGPNHD
jgi:hypothetical protein